jgi:hypothetical protein
MCPVCIAAAALVAGKVTSAGGLASIGIKKFVVRDAVVQHGASNPSKEDHHG